MTKISYFFLFCIALVIVCGFCCVNDLEARPDRLYKLTLTDGRILTLMGEPMPRGRYILINGNYYSVHSCEAVK